MDQHEWLDKLQDKKVHELSLHPRAMTRFKKELELELPDLEFDGKKEEDKKDASAPTSSGAAKTLTFTIGGLAIGVAVGVGATTLMTPPAPVCPSTPSPSTQTVPTRPAPSAVPSSGTAVPGAR